MPRIRVPYGLRRVSPEEELSVVEHLDELRRRLIVSGAALVVAFAVLYTVHNQLISALQWPLPHKYHHLLVFSPTESFMTVIKVVFGASLLVALPVWLYQLYAFVIPAVAEQTRRKMLAVVAGVSTLFAGGVTFGFFLVLPLALRFLLGFGGNNFLVQLRAGEYYSFIISMLLGAGLMFEVPIAMLAFARLGLIDAAGYRKGWRYAIVAIAAIAAVLPGGDPFSMLLLMVPQILLYILGIWLAKAFGSEPLWRREAWTTDEPEGTVTTP